jgi:hypothetical protein
MPKLTKLGALLYVNPEQGRVDILSAVRDAKGNLTHAAANLEISHRVLSRLVGQYGLWRDVDLIRAENGLKPNPKPRKWKHAKRD